MPVREVAKDFSALIREITDSGEEVVLTEGNLEVARIIPNPSIKPAFEGLSDLYGCLDADAAEALEEKITQNKSQERLIRTLPK